MSQVGLYQSSLLIFRNLICTVSLKLWNKGPASNFWRPCAPFFLSVQKGHSNETVFWAPSSIIPTVHLAPGTRVGGGWNLWHLWMLLSLMALSQNPVTPVTKIRQWHNDKGCHCLHSYSNILFFLCKPTLKSLQFISQLVQWYAYMNKPLQRCVSKETEMSMWFCFANYQICSAQQGSNATSAK